jgi:hypothetical protein
MRTQNLAGAWKSLFKSKSLCRRRLYLNLAIDDGAEGKAIFESRFVVWEMAI